VKPEKRVQEQAGGEQKRVKPNYNFVGSAEGRMEDIPVDYEEEEICGGEVLSTKSYLVTRPIDNIVEDTTVELSPILPTFEIPPPIFLKAEPKTMDYDDVTVKLFQACRNNDHQTIISLVQSGANPLALNEFSQYPLLTFCAHSIKLDVKSITKSALKSLIRNETQLNHFDQFGDTPFSIALTHDVWVWSVKVAFYHDKQPKVQDVRRVEMKSGFISEYMHNNGANLRGTKDGMTPFHVFAGRIYSREKVNIVGFGRGTMFVVLAALIVKHFMTMGKMDVNARDWKGRSGMDILVERRRANELEISDNDFDVLLDDLEKLGAKRFST
jgi:hypothetical protein